MPTTITSAGIVFNDTTSQTTAAPTSLSAMSGTVSTSQIANNAVTAAKLGTNEKLGLCKAFVNFDGTNNQINVTAASSVNLSVISGSSTGTWGSSSPWPSNWVGQIIYVNSIAGVAGATFGGLNVATVGFQITSVSGTTANVKFLAGTATSSQTISGTGSSATGYVWSTSGIRSSYNVSSITKNSTGDYTVNFATAMADANYAPSVVGSDGGSGAGLTFATEGNGPTYLKTTTQYRVMVFQYSLGTLADRSSLSVQIFGN